MKIIDNTTIYSIQELKDFWRLLFPAAPAPDDGQWSLWFLRHNPAIVREGIAELAIKYRKLGGQMDVMYMGKFASSVMNRLSSERKEPRVVVGRQNQWK